ncbi:MAG TPA: hypothetical protein DEV93_19750 [Chloroflexi bacterium]|jgi:hypothetical protein|nr:hypothetical protein [Chloroflexota bacterium]
MTNTPKTNPAISRKLVSYQGAWRLMCPFGLGFSVDLDAGEVSLDRREFELPTTRVSLLELT